MTPILQIKNITKRYGGLTAVNDVTFDVNKGEILSVIGPNGAGKSTLFKLISSFVPATSGEVLFNGTRISSLAPHKVAQMGVVRTFQETTIFRSMTVRENIIVSHHLRSKASLFGFFLDFRRIDHGRGVLAHQQVFRCRRFVEDTDAHVVEGRNDRFDLLGIDDVVRQMVVDLGVGQVATLLAERDQRLQAQAALVGVHRQCVCDGAGCLGSLQFLRFTGGRGGLCGLCSACCGGLRCGCFSRVGGCNRCFLDRFLLACILRLVLGDHVIPQICVLPTISRLSEDRPPAST